MIKNNAFIIIFQFELLLLLLFKTTATNANVSNNNIVSDNDNQQQQQQEFDSQITIRMPDIRPDYGEQYLCMSHRVKLNSNGQYIIGFQPKSNEHQVHHMLLYGCQMPGIYQRDSPNFVWDCSSMHSSELPTTETKFMAKKRNGGNGIELEESSSSSFEKGSVCDSGGNIEILYGWAMNAPALNLPKGVGFKIGADLDTKIDYLVLQVHYGHYDAFKHLPDLTDNSGLILNVIDQNNDNNNNGLISKRAGVLLMGSVGKVAMGRSKHEIWCNIDDQDQDQDQGDGIIEIHPFRFRVHTHQLGVKVMGAKISGQKSVGEFKIDRTEIIGVGDPREPQMFYPVQENITLRSGDKVYSSCEFNNYKNHEVKIGQTGEDEMCNFYLMYWTNSSKLLKNNNCFSKNPPSLLDTWIGALLN